MSRSKSNSVRLPYVLDAEFDPGASSTTISWINYNSVNPVLPEDGDDALQITFGEPTTRSTGLMASTAPTV